MKVNFQDMLKATVVSFCPFSISQSKPGLFPSYYEVDKSDEVTPSVKVIEKDAMFKVYLDEGRGHLPIQTPAHAVANSVVNDYLEGQLARDEGCGPALFWVPGAWTPQEILENFPDECKAALESQLRWYDALVRIADDDWEKMRQHTAISDTQRYAARKLGLVKPWLVERPPELDPSVKKCIACGSPVGDVVICPNCRCILDPIKAADLAFAK